MTVQELYTKIDGDYDSARKILPSDSLVGRFVVKLLNDNSFQSLIEAADAGNRQGMFEASHALKGVCGNLGLNSLAEYASVITEETRPGHEPEMSDEALAEVISQLKNKYSLTVEGIKEFQNN